MIVWGFLPLRQVLASASCLRSSLTQLTRPQLTLCLMVSGHAMANNEAQFSSTTPLKPYTIPKNIGLAALVQGSGSGWAMGVEPVSGGP